MKLIIAILRDQDNDAVSQALVAGNFRVTRVASTGGFWRRGSSTFMVGVEDDKVEEAIAVIRVNTTPVPEGEGKRATLFVLDVEHYSQI